MNNNMNNIILELRQKDASQIVANGDYEVDLAKEIIIEAGDTISLKQSFIDITNSDQIIIPYDLTISTEHILYFTDWIDDPNTKGDYVNNTGSSGVQGQGFSFVPNNVEIGAPIVGYTTYVSLEWVSLNSITATSPAFQVTYQYIDITGHTNYLVKQIPEVNVNYQDNFSIIARTGSLIVFSPSAQELLNVIEIRYNSFGASSSVPTMDKYSPFIFNASFLLKAGSYDPLDLSLTISEQLSKNGVDEINHSKFLVKSPFLKTANQFNIHQPYPNSNSPTPTISNLPIFITTDVDGNLDQRMNFIGAASYFIGSSQIAMEFNASTQKFNWSYLHFPQYDYVAGDQISVNYVPTSGGTVMAIAKNGGIAFTNLSAVIAATNEPYDFWQAVLGFNLETMIAKPKTYNGLFAGLVGEFTYYHLIDGVNTTNGFVGIDTAIVKQAGQWYMEQPITSPFSSTIDTTINIVAEKSLNELLNKFSHFLISCDLKFTNDYIGTDNFLSIQGVVNKYMSYGAYLYSSNDGSITYQHMGAPLMLKTIRCRILNSDKKIDKILGPDNTIIFEITKNMQPMMEPTK
jgi:hypothetical protein